MRKKSFPTRRLIKLATGVCLIYTAGAWGIYSEFIMNNGWILNHLDVLIAAVGIFFVFWSFKKDANCTKDEEVKE